MMKHQKPHLSPNAWYKRARGMKNKLSYTLTGRVEKKKKLWLLILTVLSLQAGHMRSDSVYLSICTFSTT